jgi:hypothetical protein
MRSISHQEAYSVHGTHSGPNNTANPVTRVCDVEEICGFGGFHGKSPDQWFRSVNPLVMDKARINVVSGPNDSFITPIFLHAGISMSCRCSERHESR